MHSLPAECSYPVPDVRPKGQQKLLVDREENHHCSIVRGERREEKDGGETQLDATGARESKLCVTGKHNGTGKLKQCTKAFV